MAELGEEERAFTSILTALERQTGYTPREANGTWNCRCPVPGHTHGMDDSPSGRVWREGRLVRVHCYRGHTWEQWARSLDVPRDFWFLRVKPADRHFEAQADEIQARYTYRRADGSEAYQVVRTRLKRFWQERPFRLDTGEELRLHGLKGGWYTKTRGLWKWYGETPPKAGVDAIYAEDAERVLYRLPELEAAALEEPVLFVEGEKDADLARSLGCLATTTAQGAANFYPEVCGPLRDRHVVVIPDNDPAGRKHAACVAGAAMMAGCASVRIAFWRPGEVPERGDFGDWFNANDWPDYDDVRRRFYAESQPFGLRDVNDQGDVLEIDDV